jgi:hypothetical protein
MGKAAARRAYHRFLLTGILHPDDIRFAELARIGYFDT